MVIAENLELIPLWTWDLIIAIMEHEDTHGADQPCWAGIMDQVPNHIHTAARGIQAYKARLPLEGQWQPPPNPAAVGG